MDSGDRPKRRNGDPYPEFLSMRLTGTVRAYLEHPRPDLREQIISLAKEAGHRWKDLENEFEELLTVPDSHILETCKELSHFECFALATLGGGTTTISGCCYENKERPRRRRMVCC